MLFLRFLKLLYMHLGVRKFLISVLFLKTTETLNFGSKAGSKPPSNIFCPAVGDSTSEIYRSMENSVALLS